MVYAQNKHARHDYELLETFEGGLALLGAEVRSIKTGGANMSASFLRFENGQLQLKNVFITPYAPAGEKNNPDPTRNRSVLLTKRELRRLEGRLATERLALIPLTLHNKGSLIKLSFALGRGKKEFEKRATIKARDLDRAIRRGVE